MPELATVNVDDSLIDQARRAGGHASDEEAVTAALHDYIRAHTKDVASSPGGILSLFGTIDYDPDYNYKARRRREVT